LNVFEASDYGADIPGFTFAEDGTPILDGATEYGLWSTGLGVDAGDVTTSSAFTYPDDDFAQDGSSKLDSQPRTADLHIPAYRNTLDLAAPRPDGSFVFTNDEALLAGSNATGLSNMHASPSAGLADGAPPPSVLHPGPAAEHMQPQVSLQPQRLPLDADSMYESQAGPSRHGLQRSRDALSATNSPYGRGRPGLQPQRSFNNMAASAGFSPPGFNPELRRLSTGGSGTPARSGRDPVVPSQNIGRARLMSWQHGQAMPGESDWQSGFPDAGSSGMSADGGFGTRGVHAMTDANGMPMQSGGMMPPSRSYSYGMHQSSSGFLPHQHGMNAHANDMINALGDAMDARIDVDGIAKCPYPNCNKTFAKNRSYNLKAHLRSHSQLKPFACAVCPRAFSRKHDLERHSRVH
jgi:hypothetical protein